MVKSHCKFPRPLQPWPIGRPGGNQRDIDRARSQARAEKNGPKEKTSQGDMLKKKEKYRIRITPIASIFTSLLTNVDSRKIPRLIFPLMLQRRECTARQAGRGRRTQGRRGRRRRQKVNRHPSPCTLRSKSPLPAASAASTDAPIVSTAFIQIRGLYNPLNLYTLTPHSHSNSRAHNAHNLTAHCTCA